MFQLLRSQHKSSAILFSCVVVLLAVLGCFACKQPATPAKPPVTDGQQKMINILSDLRRKINVAGNRYACDAKIAQCDSIAASTKDPSTQMTALLKKAIYSLEAGDEAGSVELMERLIQAVGDNKDARKMLLYWYGTACMRLAERNNCVSGHTAESCIMPIKGTGVHQNQNGSRKAITAFESLLKDDPQNYDALWLLNIAYMTLGEYPQKVPKPWLIPGLDVPDYPMKPFVDVASDLKIVTNNRSGGSIVEDFDNDGYLDIVSSAWDLSDPMHFFRNNGDGTFSDRSEQSGLSKIMGGLNIQQTDYNNDGFMDIFVLRGAWQGQAGPYGDQPNSLLRNNGDGTFTDVTIDAGILSFFPTQTATWNDFNNDGWVDVFIGNETYPSSTAHLCELYINNKNGTFTNKAVDYGLEIGLFVKGVTSGDYDNDGWPDLFFSTMSGQKMLLRNNGLQDDKLVFEDVTEQAGFSKEKFNSFTTWFFDYDNDGFLDIFVCDYEFEHELSYYAAKEALHPSDAKDGKPFIYHNNRNGTFTNVTPSMGINKVCFSMGGNFGDFNNDGFLDFYLGTGNPAYQSLVQNRLFMNVGGQKFADATNSARVGNLQKGHGVSIADLDNDGDQDIHIDMGGAFRGDAYPNSLYLNPGQNDNNWICLKLEGTKSNRAGFGAKITLKFKENGKERMVYRELNSGGSFGSSPMRREIGIGKAKVIDEISITWPASKITQVLKNVAPNQFIKAKEGQDGYEVVPLKKLTFPQGGAPIPMCAPAK